MNSLATTPSTQPQRFIRCVVNAETYCLTMAAVRSIQRLDHVQMHAPRAGGQVGTVPYGTATLPVYHLATRLGHAAAPPPATAKVLVLQTPQRTWALLVDRVEGTIDVPQHAVLPLPRIARNLQAPVCDGVVSHADTLYLSLAPVGLHPAAAQDVDGLRALAAAPEPLPAPGSLPPVPKQTGKMLCFQTGDMASQPTPLLFGLSLSQVIRTQPAPTCLPLPGAAPAVLGLVAWQGIPLAVVDLAQRLGGTPTPLRPDDRLLIARVARLRAFVGFPVRPQVSIRSLPLPYRPSTRRLPLHDVGLYSHFELAHETLVIPDIDRLYQAQEEPISCPV